MLGEKIHEGRGKLVSRRVLCVGGDKVDVENNVHETGTLLGVDFEGTTTYTNEMGPGGMASGRGKGMLITKDGAIVTYTTASSGKTDPGGKQSWRGCVFFSSSSDKYSSLNGRACVYEHEVDEDGNISESTWEWK